MNTEGIEVFIYPAGGKPVTATVNPSDTVAQVLARAGVTPSAGEYAFIGEVGDDAEVDGDDDADEPVALHKTIGDSNLRHHGHIHCHPCRRIDVTANFNNAAKSRKFAPNSRIARVRRWALKAFGLSGPAASDFALQICDSDQRPRLTQHLSELVKHGTCSICFDLVKEVTPQG